MPPVRGNGHALGQVVLNLLINAAHAIEPGKADQNEVRVRGERCESVIVEVSDTGCGIPPRT